MATAFAHGPSANPEMFAKRARMNHEAMIAFTLAITALIAIFVTSHLARRLARRWQLDRTSIIGTISGKVRGLMIRRIPALPSAGHALLVCVFLSINLIITFAHIDHENMKPHSNLASRTGWMTIANTVLVVFLALKNTPLAFLAGRSHERLNIIHQVAGYIVVVFMIVHASLYSSYFVGEGRAEFLTERNEILGMIAGFAFLGLAVSGAIIRRWWYEVFYCAHVGCWILAIIAIGLHQPETHKKIIFVTCAVAGIWVLDRLIRAARLVVYCSDNSVKLTPLANGGTRVTLDKAPIGAIAGKHCFLWIPAIRRWEMHPFTIAAVRPLEFVVASYDGFTNDLHEYAVKHPDGALRASVEGSYGAFPDPGGFHKVLFVAGGSGASFTFGMVLNMLEKIDGDARKSVVFVWTVKHRSYLDWFSRHMTTLMDDRRVTVKLFVTRESPEVACDPGEAKELPTIHAAPRTHTETLPNYQSRMARASGDSEKALATEVDTSVSIGASRQGYELPVTFARPNIGGIIRSELEETPHHHRVLIVGCGPDGLMTQVRNVAAQACGQTEGPDVELHCEQFRW